MSNIFRLIVLIVLSSGICVSQLHAADESLWIEAEHLSGIQGFCWPMGKPEMKKTAGHWGLSGPGWAVPNKRALVIGAHNASFFITKMQGTIVDLLATRIS